MIEPGTKVKTTTEHNAANWTEEAKPLRKWGIEGIVIGHHNSHGLCYEVAHFQSGASGEESWIACYDPEELEIINK